MGAGASIVDFDRDGWQDFISPTVEKEARIVFIEYERRHVQDVAGEVGLADPISREPSLDGCGLGDYDNDGYEDLSFINGVARNVS